MGVYQNNVVGNGDTVTGSITANSQSLPVDVSNFGNVVLVCSGTFSTVNVTFEASADGTTWVGVTAVRTNSATVETTTGNLSANPGYGWELSTNGYALLRVRSTAWTSGTQVWTFIRGYLPTEPNPVVSIAGTVTATSTPATGTALSVVTAASTNASSVKASAGSVYELTVSNVTATAAYVKLYNKASAPTVGTDVPVLTIQSAANTTQTVEFGAVGKRFSTGIALAVTAAAAATDTGVAVAGVQVHGTYV